MPSYRRPVHAGSWYTDDPAQLTASLDSWLQQAPDSLPKGRVIIAPLVSLYILSPIAVVRIAQNRPLTIPPPVTPATLTLALVLLTLTRHWIYRDGMIGRSS